MKGLGQIAARELRAHAESPLAWTAIVAALLAEGLYFFAAGVGGPGGAKSSAEVLLRFFDGASAAVILVALLLGMRTIARERERGTWVLLSTSPVSDGAIVLGKFVAAWAVLATLQITSLAMPALVFVHGRVAPAHVAVGYLGVLLLGGATLAVATFASAVARTQATAAALAGGLTATLLLAWVLARAVDPPWSDALRAIALHHTHQRPFMRGELGLEHVVYYLVVTGVALVAAVQSVGARRWS